MTLVLLDSLSYSEDLRVVGEATADNVMTFCEKAARIPEVKNMQGPMAKMEGAFRELGIRYGGSPISTSGIQTIFAVSPYTHSAPLREAFAALLPLTNGKFNNQTMMLRLAQAAKLFFNNDLTLSVKGWLFFFEYYWCSLSYQIILEKEVNVAHVIGKGKKSMGVVHIIWRKQQLIHWLEQTHALNLLKAFGHDAGKDNPTLWGYFKSPRAFSHRFLGKEFTLPLPLDDAGEAPEGSTHGIRKCTATKIEEYRKTLECHDAAMLTLLWGIMAEDWDPDFIALVQDEQANDIRQPWENWLRISEDAKDKEPREAQTAYAEYMETIYAKPIRVPKQGDQEEQSAQSKAESVVIKTLGSSAIGEGEGETAAQLEKKATATKLCENRIKQIKYIVPRKQLKLATDFTELYDTTEFSKAVGPQDRRLLWLDLSGWPSLIDVGPEDYRVTYPKMAYTVVPEDVKVVVQWVKTAKRANDLVAICDGRFQCVSLYIATVFADMEPQYIGAEVIVYRPPRESDIRYPGRKVAHCSTNLEMIRTMNPRVPKTRVQATPRSEFNAAGESTTHDLSYNGVPLRTLGEMPKLLPQDRRSILGGKCPLAYDGEAVQLFAKNGVPLNWAEAKPIGFLVAWLKDHKVTHVLDLAAGSGAAAIGAFYNSLMYEGVCMNKSQQAWLDTIMDNCIYTVASQKGNGMDEVMAGKVKQWFAPQVEEGLRYIEAQKENTSGNGAGPGEEEADETDF